MKQYQIDLPDKVADELEAMVQAGWFQNQGEAVRTAILDFVRRRNLDLTEEFQREDIAWAARQKTGAR